MSPNISKLLSDGILRMRYRNSFEKTELMEPGKIYEISINAGATANTFLPPWFITLFMSSHQYIRDNINIMVRILDYFVTSGWNGLMIVGIALLRNY